MDIDCSDAQYELKIGDKVRRSLIRHFRAFIITQIKTRGFAADDPRLFNQDVLDAEAWRLAATVPLRTEEHADGPLRNNPRCAAGGSPRL
jgi:hypothetical protein